MKYQYVVKGTRNDELLSKQFEDAGDAVRFAETCGWGDVRVSSVEVEAPSVDAVKSKGLSAKGKDAACKLLLAGDYETIERDWRASKYTSDIIALDGDVLVFIDVCTSRDREHCFSVYDANRERVIEKFESIALDYLASNPDIADAPVRFDVIAVAVISKERAFVKHHVNFAHQEQ